MSAQLVETVIIVVDVLIKVAAIGFVPEGRRPSSSNAWLLLILFVPLVGLPLFLLLGSPLVNRRRQEIQARFNDRLDEGLAGLPTIPAPGAVPDVWLDVVAMNRELTSLPVLTGANEGVETDYAASMASLAAAIDRAERFVHVEVFIVSWDDTTEPVFQALRRAVARGVECRLLLDHLGSLIFPGYLRLGRRLDEGGIEWRRMLPVQPWRGRWRRPDLRNHRKLVVVDGRWALIGSMNLIEAEYGSARNHRTGRRWHEANVEVSGQVVASVEAVFAVDWFKETGDWLPAADHTVDLDPEPVGGSVSACQIVPSGPGFTTEPNLRLFTALVHRARSRLLLVSPYFIPDESLLQAITTAPRRGVEVDLFVNEKSDKFFVGHAQASYYDALLRAGVRIHRYPAPAVLHAKFVVVDDELAVIGSSNLDMRSFGLSYEISLLAVGGSIPSDLGAVTEEYRRVSTSLDLDEWGRRPLHQRYLDNAFRLTSALQ